MDSDCDCDCDTTAQKNDENEKKKSAERKKRFNKTTKQNDKNMHFIFVIDVCAMSFFALQYVYIDFFHIPSYEQMKRMGRKKNKLEFIYGIDLSTNGKYSKCVDNVFCIVWEMKTRILARETFVTHTQTYNYTRHFGIGSSDRTVNVNTMFTGANEAGTKLNGK